MFNSNMNDFFGYMFATDQLNDDFSIKEEPKKRIKKLEKPKYELYEYDDIQTYDSYFEDDNFYNEDDDDILDV